LRDEHALGHPSQEESLNVNAFIKRGLIASTVTLLVLAPASIAAAATGGKVTTEHQRGPLINASFTSFDASGCIETDAFVTANRPTVHEIPGNATTTGIGAVNVFEYDSCTDTTMLQAVGELDTLSDEQFQVSNQYDWAALHATIPVTEIDTGATFDLRVDVTLVGTSVIARDHENTNDFYGGGCHVLNRWKGSGRTATASGVVSDGVTNFTPVSTDSAEIGLVIDGFVVINCP
jgi:hypothetical protein